MTTSDPSANPPVLVCWPELPDPRNAHAPDGARTAVRLEIRVWQHILGKHVLPGWEPWTNMFSSEILPRLLRLIDPCISSDPVVTDGEAIRRHVRQALERPLGLLHEARPIRSPRKRPQRVWLLVLPCGATAYVHEKKSYNRLATCYFPAYALVLKNKAFRWRRGARRLVAEYGVFEAKRNALRLPEPETVKEVKRQGCVKQLRAAIRFVTPSSWGFCHELDGVPWHGKPGEWPATEAASPGRRRLKPRDCKAPNEQELGI
jgi:hypothetical protein